MPPDTMQKTDFVALLGEVEETIRPRLGEGKVADYIPPLAAIDPDQFGIALVTTEGHCYTAGEAEVPFSIQSISKLFALWLALSRDGGNLWSRVGVEPSGDAFNSIVLLEQENGIPRNPFINAGAITVADYLVSHDTMPARSIQNLVRTLSGNEEIQINEAVALGEKETGHLNAAIAHFLKSHGNLENDPAKVLDVYFRQCAIEMSCEDLAKAILPLAATRQTPTEGDGALPLAEAEKMRAIMTTCGLYDGVGDFAVRVGIPAKSGVGGGIVGVLPGQFAVAVWSPRLDKRGNSHAGIEALALLMRRLRGW